ncbi:MAG: nucleoside hydrolase, partial [Elainellaceae cyanobacterium]
MAATVLLDTDPGGDDSVALLWLQSLARQARLNLVAVTAADGNVSAQQTYANVGRLLSLLGMSVPIGMGVAVLGAQDAAYIHGTDGMGNLAATLPPSAYIGEPPASDDLIIEQLTAQPHKISLNAIG